MKQLDNALCNDLVEFFKQCGTLTSLRALHLSGENFSTEGTSALGRLVSHLHLLEDLCIVNEFHDEERPEATALARSLSKVSKLLHISLQGFRFKVEAMASLVSTFQVHKALQTRYSYVRDAGTNILAAHFVHLPCMKNLDISYSAIGCGGHRLLASKLRELPALQLLSLVGIKGNSTC